MNVDEFFEAAVRDKVVLEVVGRAAEKADRLSNEALFHLPLIALTVLTLAATRMKPSVIEIGQLVGECFERTFVGFRHSTQHLSWSANLRVRTVNALMFLEGSALVEVSTETRKIISTEFGAAVVKRAKADELSDLGYTLRLLERNYRNIRAERQSTLRLG